MLKIHNNKVLPRAYVMYFMIDPVLFVVCWVLYFCFVVTAVSILLVLFVVVDFVCLFYFCTVDKINNKKYYQVLALCTSRETDPALRNFRCALLA